MVTLNINADDFGLTKNINKGIISLLENDCISFTSAIVCGKYFEDGISNLKPELYDRIGLHLCLNDENPISPIDKITSLVDQNTGKFFDRWEFVKKLFKNQIQKNELRTEISAQFRHFQKNGIRINHIDGHGHIHVIPQIAQIVSEIAKEYKVKYIRNPKEMDLLKSIFSLRQRKIIPIGVSAFSQLSFNRYYHSYHSSNYFFGLIYSGKLNLKILKSFIKKISYLNDCSIELMCHPGLKNIGNSYEWGYSWEKEYKSLIMIYDIIKDASNMKIINNLKEL